MVGGQTVAQPHGQFECLVVVHRFESSTHVHQYTIIDGGLLFSDKLLGGTFWQARGNFLVSSPRYGCYERELLRERSRKGMARLTPTIQGETLTWYVDTHEHQLAVGTPWWYSWLQEASLFAFV